MLGSSDARRAMTCCQVATANPKVVWEPWHCSPLKRQSEATGTRTRPARTTSIAFDLVGQPWSKDRFEQMAGFQESSERCCAISKRGGSETPTSRCSAQSIGAFPAVTGTTPTEADSPRVGHRGSTAPAGWLCARMTPAVRSATASANTSRGWIGVRSIKPIDTTCACKTSFAPFRVIEIWCSCFRSAKCRSNASTSVYVSIRVLSGTDAAPRELNRGEEHRGLGVPDAVECGQVADGERSATIVDNLGDLTREREHFPAVPFPSITATSWWSRPHTHPAL
jgi:hypothetical protein